MRTFRACLTSDAVSVSADGDIEMSNLFEMVHRTYNHYVYDFLLQPLVSYSIYYFLNICSQKIMTIIKKNIC